MKRIMIALLAVVLSVGYVQAKEKVKVKTDAEQIVEWQTEIAKYQSDVKTYETAIQNLKYLITQRVFAVDYLVKKEAEKKK